MTLAHNLKLTNGPILLFSTAKSVSVCLFSRINAITEACMMLGSSYNIHPWLLYCACYEQRISGDNHSQICSITSPIFWMLLLANDTPSPSIICYDSFCCSWWTVNQDCMRLFERKRNHHCMMMKYVQAGKCKMNEINHTVRVSTE